MQHKKLWSKRKTPQGSTKTDNTKGHKAEYGETSDGKQQLSEPPSTTTPPARPSITNSTAILKKPRKRSTRPLSACYVCNEASHIVRNCPVKHVKATKVNLSSHRIAMKPAPDIEAMSNPLPPMSMPAKIVVNFPAPRDQKTRNIAKGTSTTFQESAILSANTTAPEEPADPSSGPRKRGPRSAPQKDQGLDGVATSAPPFINTTQVSGTVDVSVSTQASKPVKKPKVKAPLACYVCKQAGHKAKSCPKKTPEPMLETVR